MEEEKEERERGRRRSSYLDILYHFRLQKLN